MHSYINMRQKLKKKDFNSLNIHFKFLKIEDI